MKSATQTSQLFFCLLTDVQLLVVNDAQTVLFVIEGHQTPLKSNEFKHNESKKCLSIFDENSKL
jgi:hypothetical protein